MDIREAVTVELKAAMKAKDADTLGVLRMINAAIKDRDIALRGEGQGEGAGPDELLSLLGKMVKQRQESAKAYSDAGRAELAQKEEAEIAVIEGFLPQKLSDAEVEAAISAAIEATGAASLRDMGKVMGALRSEYLGRMDFGAVGAQIKARLG
jgi:uncharacterized protein YqeY